MFDGDCGDDFKMGIALTPPTRGGGKGGGSEGAWGARLYAEFHYADIIIASPLGLKVSGANRSRDGSVVRGSRLFTTHDHRHNRAAARIVSSRAASVTDCDVMYCNVMYRSVGSSRSASVTTCRATTTTMTRRRAARRAASTRTASRRSRSDLGATDALLHQDIILLAPHAHVIVKIVKRRGLLL